MSITICNLLNKIKILKDIQKFYQTEVNYNEFFFLNFTFDSNYKLNGNIHKIIDIENGSYVVYFFPSGTVSPTL